MPRQVRAERSLQARPSRQRERLHRRAVVRLSGRDHLPAVRLAALDVVRARELERELVCLGAAGDEADAREAGRSDVDELARELLLRRVREALVVDVRELLGLLTRRLDDVPPTVTERGGHRAAAHRIEVAPAGGVLEPDPLAADDDRVAAVELGREHAGH